MSYFRLDLQGAGAALRDGSAVIFPTESFYALGCDALNPDAVGAVYAAKERPYRLPLPVVIGDRTQLETIVSEVTPLAEKLMNAFWPGPLSIIFPASPEVPDLLTGGTGRIAVRLSPHPAPTALCRESGLILSASSANISGQPPVTRPEELDPLLFKKIAGVFDMPPLPGGGGPSTIVDILSDGGEGTVRVLREGGVSLEALRAKGVSLVSVDG